MSGRLEAIWRKPGRREPMERLEEARLVAGEGLAGNHHRGGRRQVTIISRGAWRRAEEELGREVDPSARRANLMVRGVRLEDSAGRVLAVGPCRIHVRGETTPCGRMDEQAEGLREALRPEWRGGVYGEVAAGGRLSVGDPVRWGEPDGGS